MQFSGCCATAICVSGFERAHWPLSLTNSTPQTQNLNTKRAAMPLQYEDALAFLQTCQATEGTSVYEHLTRVIAKVQAASRASIVQHQPTRLNTVQQHIVPCMDC